MTIDFEQADAIAIATAVRSQEVSAETVLRAALERIVDRDKALNSFTAVLHEQAIAEAQQIDVAIAKGEDPGMFAGVPFAVKNLLRAYQLWQEPRLIRIDCLLLKMQRQYGR
jgi:Asp-tRNA(Asn)/Glu-tRNA(Gln) amidotransferase A subunit family amidase